MKIKPGVNVAGLRPEMVLALIAAQRVYGEHDTVPTITSALDSKHGRGSLHFAGQALDLRTKDLPAGAAPVIFRQLADALGDQYDVLLEGFGTANEHIHVEFQPKG